MSIYYTTFLEGAGQWTKCVQVFSCTGVSHVRPVFIGTIAQSKTLARNSKKRTHSPTVSEATGTCRNERITTNLTNVAGINYQYRDCDRQRTSTIRTHKNIVMPYANIVRLF
ncbi:hypothetical protein RvY_05247 [Ramazzottius varieornatus]|uniref:Uncharacterized protein n=1 Tax=Ramazzottius varieornatus TaxID=947166 RepID=A0A1D1V017_RAMVA|nr:hypothetical protein RvY_05247 [Ramazzottius varieornatus]